MTGSSTRPVAMSLIGKCLLLVGLVCIVIGFLGVQVDRKRAGCMGLIDPSMVPQITVLEAVQVEPTLFPLGGERCRYPLVGGGEYVETSSWASTVTVLVSAAMIGSGVVLLWMSRARRSR